MSDISSDKNLATPKNRRDVAKRTSRTSAGAPNTFAALTVTASSFARAAVIAAGVDVASVTWRISAMLAEHGSLRPSEIAQRERTSRATTSEVIKRMESEGRIFRVQNDNDKRSVLLALTPKGYRELESWRSRVAEVITPLITSLPKEEREILAQAEEILHSLTKKIREESLS